MGKQLKNIQCYLLDLDGTIYLSDQLIDGALSFLNLLHKQDKNYIFLTNNSSKSKEDYYQKLTSMGIKTTKDQIFTSANATTYWINKQKKEATVFLLGTQALEQEFKASGIDLTDKRGQDIDYVVLGFDTSLTYEKLWIACDYIRSGIPFIATHPDINCPLKGGAYMPDTGAMIKLIEASTGVSPIIIGKPNTAMIEAVLDIYKLKAENTAMVGDRLYTDMQMAKNADLTGILVFSGETTPDDLKSAKIRPDFALDNVKEIAQILEKL